MHEQLLKVRDLYPESRTFGPQGPGPNYYVYYKVGKAKANPTMMTIMSIMLHDKAIMKKNAIKGMSYGRQACSTTVEVCDVMKRWPSLSMVAMLVEPQHLPERCHARPRHLQGSYLSALY